MKTTANILVKGVKQKLYFNNTVFLEGDTEFEIEFFNKSQRTVCPSLTINGEQLSSSPVIYNGQKLILRDFISDNRRFLFKTYLVDTNDPDVTEAIKENGVILIKYYYEKRIIVPPSKLSTEVDGYRIQESRSTIHKENPDESNSKTFPKEMSDILSDLPIEKEDKEETGKITKGSYSGVTYRSVNIELDYSEFETQIIKLLPLSKKPKLINCPECEYESKIDVNYCENCGYKY